MACSFRVLYKNVPSRVLRLLAIEVMLQERIWGGGFRGRKCLSGGEPGRGLVYWGLVCRTVWRRAPLSIGAPLGHMGGESIHQKLSEYSQLYSAGLFSTSVINLLLSKSLKSRSMMSTLAWNARRRLVAVRLFCCSCTQAGMFFRVPLPPPTAVRPPHHTENEACCVWKNAAVKQLSVRSLPFKTEHFIPAAAMAVSPLRLKTARAC